MILGYHHLIRGQSVSQESFIRLLMMWGHHRGYKLERIGPQWPWREAGRGCIWVQISICPSQHLPPNLFLAGFLFSGLVLAQRVPAYLSLGRAGVGVGGLPAAFNSSEKWMSCLWLIYLPGPSSHPPWGEVTYLPDSCCPVPLGSCSSVWHSNMPWGWLSLLRDVSLYRSAWAIITKYHRLGGLNNRHLLLMVLETGSLRAECQPGWGLVRAHPPTVCSHGGEKGGSGLSIFL